jgi:hypothetical protein
MASGKGAGLIFAEGAITPPDPSQKMEMMELFLQQYT